MAFHWFLFPAAIVLLPVATVFADDRTTIAQRIEELGSTSGLDSWPMSDRENARYQLMLHDAQTSVDAMRTMFEQTQLDGCVLTLRKGFLQTGQALPVVEISFDLKEPTVALDLPMGDGAGQGFAIIRIQVDDPDQTMKVILLPEAGGAAAVEAKVREQTFETRPGSQYAFPVNFPKDRPSPVPDFLGAILKYRAQFCASVS